jgi:hypothetical protein
VIRAVLRTHFFGLIWSYMYRSDWPVSQLSLPEKLNLLEAIWEDLGRNENTLESPVWHEKILKDREAALANGEVTVSDWDGAKERIRREASLI